MISLFLSLYWHVLSDLLVSDSKHCIGLDFHIHLKGSWIYAWSTVCYYHRLLLLTLQIVIIVIIYHLQSVVAVLRGLNTAYFVNQSHITTNTTTVSFRWFRKRSHVLVFYNFPRLRDNFLGAHQAFSFHLWYLILCANFTLFLHIL